MAYPQNPWQQGVPSGFPVWDDAGLANATGIQVGYAICFDPTDADFRNLILPGGSASANLVGVMLDDYGTAGPAVGKPINFRKMGRGKAVLTAGVSCTRGDYLITDGTSGTFRVRTNETGCVSLGRVRETLTGGASALEVAVDIQLTNF